MIEFNFVPPALMCRALAPPSTTRITQRAARRVLGGFAAF
jgi:hypothetical protein